MLEYAHRWEETHTHRERERERERETECHLQIYNTVNLAYNVPVGTSVFCPLYTKSVLRVYRTLSVIVYTVLCLL